MRPAHVATYAGGKDAGGVSASLSHIYHSRQLRSAAPCRTTLAQAIAVVVVAVAVLVNKVEAAMLVVAVARVAVAKGMERWDQAVAKMNIEVEHERWAMVVTQATGATVEAEMEVTMDDLQVNERLFLRSFLRRCCWRRWPKVP